LDALDVGIVRAIIVDGDAIAMLAQGLHEAVEQLVRRAALLGDLAHDAAGFHIRLVQHQPHVAQRRLGDLTVVEQRGIEIDEDAGLGRQADAGVEEMKRPAECLDMAAVERRDAWEEDRRRYGFTIPRRAYQSLEGGDGQLSLPEGEDWLESALQRERA